MEAVEKYSKLMILGKPGAGKTTFLKYLAIQCLAGEYQAERVPIFVTLKNFAEAENKPRLLEYITEEPINPISSIRDVITYGKALVLLDGLDEVREEDSDRILKEIREFSDRFLNNQFVMTCRIAAREYTFEKFTEVEVADFDDDQISNFANNWFKEKAVKPETFISVCCKASIRREFPSEFLNYYLEDIKINKSASGKKAWKLLNDNIFKK
ncbi:NACHT domain-containing protein [uncultured Nostoc sp.]|uniref:NACHT domain-containing protein n=1 Tax=uncultured Nostoc sp. TaxID=340711 RepID=UPI0035CBA016